MPCSRFPFPVSHFPTWHPQPHLVLSGILLQVVPTTIHLLEQPSILMPDHHYYSNFIWQIADLLRGPYRPPQYERVMLPLTVLRRFDCVLEPNKESVVSAYELLKDKHRGEALDKILNDKAGQRFHNHSRLTFQRLKGDPDHVDRHLVSYIQGFSKNVRDIFEKFEFEKEIEKMREANILYLIILKFNDVDLHPNVLDNIGMGLVFEDLIRRFNEAANETAGDYFTPREVIRLMVDILFANDDEFLTQPGAIRKLLDPTCGTGGMLTEAQNYLRDHNSESTLYVFGQDFNPRAYAIAASDLLMKSSKSGMGEDSASDEALVKGYQNSEIRFGDSLIDDQYPPHDDTTKGRFDYLLANPPFGVDWKRQHKEIKREHDKLGLKGRFGAGLPRVNDGALLFLQHMISKFEPYNPAQKQDGSRLAIVFNGSPLFTGGAGSGESEVRKWVIENDWLEAIVALPEQMFFNTGISTYIWIVTNRKAEERKGKIQLVDARSYWIPMRRSLGDKRRKIGGYEENEPNQIAEIVKLYGDFAESKVSKIFLNSDFGYQRLPIERPLRLVYQMDVERKSNFLDAVPHLLDDVQAIDRQLGREPRHDWSDFDGLMQDLLKARGSKWVKPELKLFRDVFTERDPQAMGVITKSRPAKNNRAERVWGWLPSPRPEEAKREVQYEADSQLRDQENIRFERTDHAVGEKPDKEMDSEAVDYFYKEVEPHVRDAWADRNKRRSAYEINFNRHFYEYTPPRPLAEIDAELKGLEEEIVKLLREVVG